MCFVKSWGIKTKFTKGVHVKKSPKKFSYIIQNKIKSFYDSSYSHTKTKTLFNSFLTISSNYFLVAIRLERQNFLQLTSTVYLLRFPGARKECAVIMTMHWNVQNMGVIIKHLLCAVAMVNILRNQITTL
jgi:hypothetical protein